MPETLFVVEWLEVAIISAVILAVMAGAQLLRSSMNMNPEGSRKLVHFASGCVVCTFPFVFNALGSVALLCLVFLLIMVVSLLNQWLSSIHEVGRESGGAFLFPVAVFLIFYLSGGNWIYFLVPMLLLTVPDAAAALIGKRYGLISYSVHQQTRSLEGSAIFFLFSFNVILIPTLLWGGVSNEVAILVALLLALIITGIESVCILGVDNLFVPLVGYIGMGLLDYMPEQLLINMAVLVGAFGVLLLLNNWKQFTLSGIIGFSLMLYTIYSWGGWSWLIPAFWYLLTFNLGVGLTGFNRRAMPFLSVERSRGLFEISAVFHLSAAPLIVLLLNRIEPHPDYYSLFLALIGVATAIAYFHFVPFQLRKRPIAWIPPGTYRSLFFRAGVGLAGTAVVYGLSLIGETRPGHGIELQLAMAAVAMLLLYGLNRSVVARYQCRRCGRTVFTPYHCQEECRHISGVRWIGIWQGVFLVMLTVVGMMLAINMIYEVQ